MQEIDYWIDLETVVNLGIDCVLEATAVETNLTNATLETLKKMAQKKDKQLTNELAKINVEYFIRLFIKPADPITNISEELIFEYSTLSSPSDYFIIHMNISSLPALITKYSLRLKDDVIMGV